MMIGVMLKRTEASRVFGEAVGDVMSNDNVVRPRLNCLWFGNWGEKRARWRGGTLGKKW